MMFLYIAGKIVFLHLVCSILQSFTYTISQIKVIKMICIMYHDFNLVSLNMRGHVISWLQRQGYLYEYKLLCQNYF